MIYSARDERRTTSEHRLTVGDYVLLASSVLSMVAACILLSARKQAWMDEIFTWKEASDPSLRHLFHAIQHGADGGPPLFYLTVWIWDRVFGGGVLSLRLYSCVAMCGALIVTWKTIRRFYGLWATAFGVLLIWGTSATILDQNAEARFYGLYMLTAAIAVYLYIRLTEQPTPGKGLMAAVVLAQAALVMTHIFGLIYGGLILLALIFSDARQGRLRWKIYLLYAFGWLTLLTWIPALRASMAVGKPRGWILMPTLHDLTESYGYDILGGWVVLVQRHTQGWGFFAMRHLAQLLIVAPVMVVLALVLRSFVFRKPRSGEKPAGPLLPVAIALLSMPAVLFVLSHLVAPVFVPRYSLPSGIGLAIILAIFADAAGADRRFSPGKTPFLWLVFTVALLICPIVSALIVESSYAQVSFLDVERLDREIPPNSLLVADWLMDFSKIMRFSNHPKSYYYLLDWPTALAEFRGSITNYHLMHAYRDAGYYGQRIQDQRMFLCENADFYVLDAADRRFYGKTWFDMVIRGRPQFEWKTVDTFDAVSARRTLILVHRVGALPDCDRP